MQATLVLVVLISLGLVWGAVWLWVVLNTGRSAPYEEVAARTGRLRRPLFYAIVVVLVVVFFVSLIALPYPQFRASALGPPQLTVRVQSQQWSWHLSQTSIPAGVPVEFDVTAQDVNHDFAIYNASGELVAQVQAMPGYTNRLIHVFDQPGQYTIRCLEYCGIGHHVMVTTLIVS